ncbi:hypothetical protein UFOVP247_75 [uncultured Caudovirales phage]|uniref:Uncharacterized protein n=1 Tax=uncultured Caudovirales phage TaxID=2100421 RepID=A0A6J7WTH6_9CAUD|nr:hypothetical protein UFOVP247_75 [uncultured Caudovirales phage]
MARMKVSEILKRCSEFKKKEERIETLRINCNEACKIILQYMFHPDVKFALPEGKPPFTYSQFNEANVLHSEARRLYLFLEGVNPEMKPVRRETLFLEILQTVDPEDADLLIAMKDKTCPYKGLTKDVVYAAFPELFPT